MHEIRSDPLDAPPYVVACWAIDRAAGEGHEHVVAIETGDPDGGQTRWATVEVIAAVREGERFVVGEEGGDGRPSLEPAVCPGCATVTLAVNPGVNVPSCS